MPRTVNSPSSYNNDNDSPDNSDSYIDILSFERLLNTLGFIFGVIIIQYKLYLDSFKLYRDSVRTKLYQNCGKIQLKLCLTKYHPKCKMFAEKDVQL